MAKDGTLRGGKRPGQGRPAKGLKEKVDAGNPGHRPLKVVQLPQPDQIDVDDVPDPREYMDDPQNRNNGEFYASEIFKETMQWLKQTGCEKLVDRQIVDMYAVSAARWIQCERAISKHSLLAPHPTTKIPIASPFAALSQQYAKQVMNIWYSISQIVKENSLVDFNEGTPQDSVMEQLLRAREK